MRPESHPLPTRPPTPHRRDRRRSLTALALAAVVLAAGLILAAAPAAAQVGTADPGVGAVERPTLRQGPPEKLTGSGLPRSEPPVRRTDPRGDDGEIRTHAALSRSASGRAAGHVVVRFARGLARWQEDAIATGLGAAALDRARFGDFARVEVPEGATPEEMVDRFRSHPSVAWAGTDPLVRAADVSWTAAPDSVSAAATDDPFFSAQWYLQRIHLEEALARNPADGGGVVVAVIDTGVAYGNGATFPARQVPDLGGVPILPGWDFVDNDPQPLDLGSTSVRPTENPRFGHGTMVATIIAAQVDNGIAGAGVAPRVSILPVRVLGIDGRGFSSWIAEGIRFAVDNGADVINLSLGGTSSFEPGAEAVRYALSRGVVVVAAAGNEADDEEVFADELGNDVAWPARYPGVIAVGATDFDDSRATYSNFGPNLDIMAPAGNDTNREVGGNSRDGVLSTSFLHFPTTGETLYGGFIANGTSFAAPQVAGVAALLMSLGVEGTEVVEAILRLTTTELQDEGFDLQTGHGLLDAAAAHRGLGLTN